LTTKAKRSPWIILLWPASLLLILSTIWITGYVYWQIRISRAMAELKKGPERYENRLFYADPDLLEIGSRGVLRCLREWEDALDRGDENQAFAFYCGLGDLLHGASEVSAEAAKATSSYTRTPERPPLQEMRDECKQYLQQWSEVKTWFAPWWQWWNGHELRRGYRRSW